MAEVVVSPNGITSAKELGSLTYDMCPKGLGAYAKTMAESQQVSPSMAILCGVATVNASVAGKHLTAPVTEDVWLEEGSSLNVTIIAESSAGKSRVFDKVTKPLREWEQEKRQELLPAYAEAKKEVKAKRDALKDLQEQAYPEPAEEPESDEVKGDPVAKDELSTGHAQMELQEALANVPVIPDLMVSDATAPALEVRCAEHEGRLALFDPEGGPLKNISGQTWNAPASFELLKKAWDHSDHRTDRIGRGTTEIHQPAITTLLMTQPSLMEEMAQHPAMKGEGLWNRFLFFYQPDNRENLIASHKASKIDPKVASNWDKTIRRLLNSNHKGTKPYVNRDGTKVQQVPIRHRIPLSEGAQTVKEGFEESILREIQTGHRLEKVHQWAGKAVGIAVRIASDMELFERASGGIEGAQLFETTISKKSMEMAVQIVDVLADHFIYVMEVKARFDPVLYVYDKILSLPHEERSRREIIRRCRRKGVSKKPEITPILAELENRGLVKEVIREGRKGQFTPYYFDPDEYTDELERDAIQHENTDPHVTRDTVAHVTP